MKLLRADTWLKSPADRETIARWTVRGSHNQRHRLDLPAPADPRRSQFLVTGDSGDSDASGPRLSPQDAVAVEMAKDAALPDFDGSAELVLHTGDIVYMAGERRLYDRNFRRPYAAFLTPESTVDSLVFRLPFLPVPGNHDYYDLSGWLRWLQRVPLLGAGLRAIAHELFAFSLPEGGSDGGRVYMQTFVDPSGSSRPGPLAYRPGERTRLPNRYYRFRFGMADFFALDSNTLDAPPPWKDADRMRGRAELQVEALEARANELDSRLRQEQEALERWQQDRRKAAASDPSRRAAIASSAAEVLSALRQLAAHLEQARPSMEARAAALAAVKGAHQRWKEVRDRLIAAEDPGDALRALRGLEEADDEGRVALRSLEGYLLHLPEGETRVWLLAARDELERALLASSDAVAPAPAELCARIKALTEDALDVQRELAASRRRSQYQPEDYDADQLRWLEEGLEEAVRERPEGWRIVYLHHPPYTTVANHSERPDVQAVRSNLLDLVRGRVHLVVGGHSHAFEWLRSAELPETGLFVTGGGGQVSLRPSLLSPEAFGGNRRKYDSLRTAGLVECAVAGCGPAASDGETGRLYHYLRVEVTEEALVVRPVGVRYLEEGHRREEPMPVYHAPELPPGQPPWEARHLAAVEIRRGLPPRPVWA